MHYEIIWIKDAESDLAQIWLNADNRQSILIACQNIDSALEINPLDCGESRAENRRIGFTHPLGFEFEVLARERKVYVLAIWRFA
jgi:hypothetical protein